MTIRSTAAALLAPLALAGTLSAQAVSIRPLLARADSLLRASRYAPAADAYREVLRRDSTQIGATLGLARAEAGAGRTGESIRWHRRALELGVGVRSEVSYRIAQLHAGRGERDSTIAWLERSLAARLEARGRIGRDSSFARWADEPVFRRLAGREGSELADRVAGWRADVDHLVVEARRMHAGPDRPAHGPAFAEAAEALKRRVPELTDVRVAVELQRLLASLGDGHSLLYPFPTPKVPFARVPLDLWQFSDGLVVIGADSSQARRVGQRVVAIGGVAVGEALARLEPYVSRDNPMGMLVLGTFFLTMPPFVEAAGLGDGRGVTYTFETSDGRRETVSLAASGLRAPAFKIPPAPGAAPAPLYLRRPDDNLWLTPLQNDAVVYMQFNQVRDQPTIAVAAFADSLRRTLRRTGARDLIVDVRRNNGGNSSLNRPLLRALVEFDLQPGRRIWVLTARTTFSASQNFINQVERLTDATFAGEPSASKPNFAGEDTEVVFPYSGLRASISTRWWQDSGPLDRREWIAPDLTVPVRSADYFAGRDPVLAAVLEEIERPDR
ncbi:MAG: hypothetical protein R2909_11840 [Gemmatimonadales bacterium]